MKSNYKRVSGLIIFLVLILSFLIGGILVFLLYPYDVNFYQESPNYQTLSIKKPIYIMPYIGDIDGEVSEDWFFFYEKITDFHDSENIPVTFSFFPSSIGDEDFNEIFLKMYENEYVELMQKGYKGDAREMEMYKLSMEEQKQIIKSGQDVFKKRMGGILKENNKGGYVKVPIAYNQIGGIINNKTKTALKELGFKMYFDVFVEGDFVAVESDENFDIIEYGISFTKNGYAGKENKFKTPLEITSKINNFDREDVPVMTINGRKVIPIWAHQQDFESMNKEDKLDKEKWNIYVHTLKALKKDLNVKFITPEKLYFIKHGGIIL